MSTPFIQLTHEQCRYLLELIHDMDSDTRYTAKQRLYTVPKLVAIANGTFDRKLMYQDVNYLLELIEDDEVPSTIKDSTCKTLQAIKELQNEALALSEQIDEQRAQRRSKRLKA